MFTLFVTAILALVAGLVVGLKVLAPKTKTKADDKLLKFLEEYGPTVVELLQSVVGATKKP